MIEVRARYDKARNETVRLVRAGKTKVDRVLQVTPGITAAMLVLSVLGAWSITRSLTGPVGRAVQVARAVAAGDLSARVEVTSQDETRQLLAARAAERLALGHGLVGLGARLRHADGALARECRHDDAHMHEFVIGRVGISDRYRQAETWGSRRIVRRARALLRAGVGYPAPGTRETVRSSSASSTTSGCRRERRHVRSPARVVTPQAA